MKISEQPYKRIWGGVRSACEYVAKYHAGQITKKQLLEGHVSIRTRIPLPLNVRFVVLKRDNFRCVKCGRSPSSNHAIELEVDHIKPVAKGGTNNIENLQTLCKDCNQGKKDRE